MLYNVYAKGTRSVLTAAGRQNSPIFHKRNRKGLRVCIASRLFGRRPGRNHNRVSTPQTSYHPINGNGGVSIIGPRDGALFSRSTRAHRHNA